MGRIGRCIMEIRELSYKKELFNFNYKFSAKKIYGILGSATTLFELIKGIKKPTSGDVINSGRSFILYDSRLDVVDKSFFRDEELKKICKKLGINDKFLDKDFDSLTDSERLRANYIVMKAYNPDVVMFDGFFDKLDYDIKKVIIEDIKKMEFDESKIIIIASNNTDLIFELCDEVILLDQEIKLSGNKFDVFEDTDLLKTLGFDIPTCTLFSDFVSSVKGIKLPYRDRVSDIAKDVYDNV